MDRNKFDSLTIQEQINYVNTKLDEGNSLNNVLKEIGIPKTTFRDRATKYGYKFDKEKRNYILVENIVQNKNDYEEIENVQDEIFTEKELVRKLLPDGQIICEEVTTTNNIYKMITEELHLLRQQLDEVYSWYEKQKGIIEKEELKINKFKGEPENRTYKIYPEVLKAFNKFCKEHRQYKVQDLISQALWEFIKKYE